MREDHEDLPALRRAIERLWMEAESLARAVDRELGGVDDAARALADRPARTPPASGQQ